MSSTKDITTEVDIKYYADMFKGYNSNFKKKVRLELERELSFSVDEQEAAARRQYYIPYVPVAEDAPIMQRETRNQAAGNQAVAATPEEIVEDVLFD